MTLYIVVGSDTDIVKKDFMYLTPYCVKFNYLNVKIPIYPTIFEFVLSRSANNSSYTPIMNYSPFRLGLFDATLKVISNIVYRYIF